MKDERPAAGMMVGMLAFFGVGPVEIFICCGLVIPALVAAAVSFAVRASRKDRDRP